MKIAERIIKAVRQDINRQPHVAIMVCILLFIFVLPKPAKIFAVGMKYGYLLFAFLEYWKKRKEYKAEKTEILKQLHILKRFLATKDNFISRYEFPNQIEKSKWN